MHGSLHHGSTTSSVYGKYWMVWKRRFGASLIEERYQTAQNKSMNRRIMLTGVTLFVLGVVFLYLLGVVSVHQREFKEMRKGTPDSIRVNDTMFMLKGVAGR